MVEKRAAQHADDERRFIENMKRLREELGWSQTELARRMVDAGWENYTQMTVSRTEKFERPLRLSESRSLAQTLGSTPEEMVLRGLDSRVIDDLKSSIDYMIDSEKHVELSVKSFVVNQHGLRLMLLTTERLETRTWGNPGAIQRLEELRNIAQQLSGLSVQTVVDGAIAKQHLDDGGYLPEVRNGEHQEKG